MNQGKMNTLKLSNKNIRGKNDEEVQIRLGMVENSFYNLKKTEKLNAEKRNFVLNTEVPYLAHSMAHSYDVDSSKYKEKKIVVNKKTEE